MKEWKLKKKQIILIRMKIMIIIKSIQHKTLWKDWIETIMEWGKDQDLIQEIITTKGMMMKIDIIKEKGNIKINIIKIEEKEMMDQEIVLDVEEMAIW